MNWVKVAGSDVRLEYPSKRVDEPDGVHYHFEPDHTRAPTRASVTPTILEDHGDGTYTSWRYTVFGPVGERGKLRPEIAVAPITTKADREAVARLEALMAKAMRSQAAMVEIAKAHRDLTKGRQHGR